MRFKVGDRVLFRGRGATITSVKNRFGTPIYSIDPHWANGCNCYYTSELELVESLKNEIPILINGQPINPKYQDIA